MEKIDKEQLNNLIEVLEENSIKSKWIMSICNVESLTDITTMQYNFLLLLIKKVFMREEGIYENII